MLVHVTDSKFENVESHIYIFLMSGVNFNTHFYGKTLPHQVCELPKYRLSYSPLCYELVLGITLHEQICNIQVLCKTIYIYNVHKSAQNPPLENLKGHHYPISCFMFHVKFLIGSIRSLTIRNRLKQNIYCPMRSVCNCQALTCYGRQHILAYIVPDYSILSCTV